MTTPHNSQRDAANEFLRLVRNGEPHAIQAFNRFHKGSLSDLVDLGEHFFNALDAASARFSASPDEQVVANNACLVTDAILHCGITWDAALVTEKGFASLENARAAAMEAGHQLLAHRTLCALAHLAPLFDLNQVEALSREDRYLDADERYGTGIRVFDELMLASPRQVLLHESQQELFRGDIENTLLVASSGLNAIKNALSGFGDGITSELDRSILIALQFINSISLLIPELIRAECEMPQGIQSALDDIVDSLSWLVEARNRLDAVAKASPQLFEKLDQLRDHAWLGVTLLLHPSAPWVARHENVRARLTRIALGIVEENRALGRSRTGHLPLEFFLATIDPAGAGGEAFFDRFEQRVCGQLARYFTDGFATPNYVAGVAASVVTWISQSDRVLMAQAAPDFPEVVRKRATAALQGRAFAPDVQAFLVRAVRENGEQ